MQALTHHAEFLRVQQAAFSLAQVLMPGQDLEASSQLPQVLSGHVVRAGGRRLVRLLVSLVLTMVMMAQTAAALAPLVAQLCLGLVHAAQMLLRPFLEDDHVAAAGSTVCCC